MYDIKGISPTLNTAQGGHRQPKILVPEKTKKGYTEAKDGDGVYINRPHQKRGVVQKNMIQTLKTSCSDVGVVVMKDGKCNIRKLAPLECYRLMGFDDEDFHKDEKVNSNTQLYKQVGNSIVVDVLYYIFKEFFCMTTQEKLKEVEKRIRNSTSYKNKKDLLKHKKKTVKTV